jgi:hypothetical protein
MVIYKCIYWAYSLTMCSVRWTPCIYNNDILYLEYIFVRKLMCISVHIDTENH